MATVTGKTSPHIDQLLADMVVDVAVEDGNLIVTHRDGAVQDLGGIGGTNSVQRLFYTNGSYPARPASVQCIDWWGPTLPPQMSAQDSWVNTT